MKCPKCKSELEKVYVEIEDAESRAMSYQCKCGYFTFDPRSAIKVIKEIKAKETPLFIQQRIIKLSKGRLGMYFNKDVARSLKLEAGKEILIAVPDKKHIVLKLS